MAAGRGEKKADERVIDNHPSRSRVQACVKLYIPSGFTH